MQSINSDASTRKQPKYMTKNRNSKRRKPETPTSVTDLNHLQPSLILTTFLPKIYVNLPFMVIPKPPYKISHSHLTSHTLTIHPHQRNAVSFTNRNRGIQIYQQNADVSPENQVTNLNLKWLQFCDRTILNVISVLSLKTCFNKSVFKHS